jgi:hypothetical protein
MTIFTAIVYDWLDILISVLLSSGVVWNLMLYILSGVLLILIAYMPNVK